MFFYMPAFWQAGFMLEGGIKSGSRMTRIMRMEQIWRLFMMLIVEFPTLGTSRLEELQKMDRWQPHLNPTYPWYDY
jgi:hypothetical protein